MGLEGHPAGSFGVASNSRSQGCGGFKPHIACGDDLKIKILK